MQAKLFAERCSTRLFCRSMHFNDVPGPRKYNFVFAFLQLLQTADCRLLTADCKLIAGQQKGRNCSRVLTQRMATIAASLMSSKMRATMKSWPGSKPRPIPRWPTPLGIPHRPARHSHPLFAHLSHCTRVIKCNFIATIGGPYKKYVGCGFWP